MRRFIIHIRGTDRYLVKNLKEGARSAAVVDTEQGSKNRAQKRFGPDWEKHAEIEDKFPSEIMAEMGRKGGSKMSPAKMAWLHARTEKMPVKWWQGELAGQKIIVGARHHKAAAEFLKEAGFGEGLYWTIYRKFKERTSDFDRHKPYQVGVWVKNGEWQKIL